MKRNKRLKIKETIVTHISNNKIKKDYIEYHPRSKK